MAEVRQAARADLDPLSTTLAKAFHDDPVMLWLGGTGHARLRRFFRTDVAHHLRTGQVFATPSNEAAALWLPPDGWRASVTETVRCAPAIATAFGLRGHRTLRILIAMERAHPREPHWYLARLGTAPEHQGKGRGAALMHPILDKCDESGLGAYLESSKERNIPYYERFGFKVTGEIKPAKSGPIMWSMWRDPAEPQV